MLLLWIIISLSILLEDAVRNEVHRKQRGRQSGKEKSNNTQTDQVINMSNAFKNLSEAV